MQISGMRQREEVHSSYSIPAWNVKMPSHNQRLSNHSIQSGNITFTISHFSAQLHRFQKSDYHSLWRREGKYKLTKEKCKSALRCILCFNRKSVLVGLAAKKMYSHEHKPLSEIINVCVCACLVSTSLWKASLIKPFVLPKWQKKVEPGEQKAVIVSECRDWRARYTKTSQFTARVAISASLSIRNNATADSLHPRIITLNWIISATC